MITRRKFFNMIGAAAAAVVALPKLVAAAKEEPIQQWRGRAIRFKDQRIYFSRQDDPNDFDLKPIAGTQSYNSVPIVWDHLEWNTKAYLG